MISLRAKGVTFCKIHEFICSKEYTGSVASVGVFIQKERCHMKRESGPENTEAFGYFPRKILCQLIYKSIEEVKGITKEQYETAIKKVSYARTVVSLTKGVSSNYIFT